VDYSWDFGAVWRNRDALLAGLWVTAQLTFFSVGGGTLAGVVLLFARRSKIAPLRWLAMALIEIFRDLPVLVAIIWMYYCLPILLGDRFLHFTSFAVAVIGLGANFGALQAEIFRAGLEAIPAGEIAAARGLNLRRRHILLHIVVPQTFWRSLAPTLGQIVNTIKLTALASFVFVPDLYYQTVQLITVTLRPLELYTAMAFCYLLIIIPLSLITQRMERQLSGRFRSG
jgi:polar amino acid transport system permease protein